MREIRNRKKYILLNMLLCWIFLIFFMSSKPADASLKDSSLIVDTLVNIFNLNYKYVDVLTTIVRKSAHFTEYFILCILSTFTYKGFKGDKLNFSSVLLLCLLVAVFDEFLQKFIPGRSSEVKDVLIDFSGATLFFIIYKLRSILVKAKCKRF